MTAVQPRERAEVVVDLDAIRHNVRRLRELVSGGDTAPQLMVVVKSDGYGHGMAPVARASRQAGAEWLGVATAEEALALRSGGDTGRVLCWLAVPDEDLTGPIAADVDVAAYGGAQLDGIAAAARALGRFARVHLKVDTGLSRGGATLADWPALVARAAEVERTGDVRVIGIWSHFACSDQPGHPANAAQLAAFRDALATAGAAGLDPEVRHLANSAGALLLPESRFDLVRLGIATYGLTPAPRVRSSDQLGLVPAMTVRARVVLGKDIEAGAGVSYGHVFTAPEPMHVALVPLGYGDGVPRHASNVAQVMVRGRRAPLLGRVCMDQFVVGAPAAGAGDEVVLFGPGADGEPTAQEWADWCGTISYEIVTRMHGRQPRTWVHDD